MNFQKLSRTLILLSIIFSFHFSLAATSLGYQALSGNTIWTPTASPYLINGWINIPTGSSLTILPGTIVKLGDAAKLEVNGTLTSGVAGQPPVSITALTDDTVGGDDNGDGASSSPHPGSWGNIQIRPSAQVTLTNTTISYGGILYEDGHYLFGMINNLGGTFTATDSTFSSTVDSLIVHQYGTTTLQHNIFTGASTALRAETLSGITNMGSLTIGTNTFTPSVSRAVFISNYLTPFSFTNGGGNQGGGITMNTVNLFGSTTLPADLPYTIENWVNVPLNSSLTILPGATFKGAGGSYLSVAGTLIAQGTSTAPITFTSNAPTPHAGDWGGIITTTTGSTTLAEVNLSYGGTTRDFSQLHQLQNDGGLLSLDHVTSASSSLAGLSITGGTTTVTHSTFRDNQYGIFRTGGDLTLTDSAIVHNGSYGLFNSGSIIDARNNWWGDPSGPFHSTVNPTGTGNSVSDHVAFVPWLTEAPNFDATTTEGTCVEDCYSVMFIPGFSGSRLFRGTDKVWFPALSGTDADVKDLFMTASGTSVKSDVTAKDGDIVEDAYNAKDVYKGLPQLLNSLRDTHAIADWKVASYDWRLDYETLLNNGAQSGDLISYLTPTSTPYILQTLRTLAAKAKTHKVIIVTHSNGGLLAKSLIKKLDDAHDPLLANIDQVVLVAPPQLGAPKSLVAVLHGEENPLKEIGPLAMSDTAFRQLIENMPAMYNFLPSYAYNIPSEKYIHFDYPSGHSAIATKAQAKYGTYDMDPLLNQLRSYYPYDSVTRDNLSFFLTGEHGQRAKPTANDLVSPNVLNEDLLDHATEVHTNLDNYHFPVTIPVTQIAGWGLPTISGIEYMRGDPSCVTFGFLTCKPIFALDHKPILSADGDETVPTRSALAMDDAAKVFVDLKTYNLNSTTTNDSIDRAHSNIMGAQPVKNLIEHLIKHESIDGIPYTKNFPPTGTHYIMAEKHSPVELDAYDSYGNHTGYTYRMIEGINTRIIEENIPNSSYIVMGSSTYVIFPGGTTTQVKISGTGEGTMTFGLTEYVDDVTTATTTFRDVPVTASSTGSIIVDTVANASPLEIDSNGDGTVDQSIVPKLNGEVVFDTTPPEVLITFSTSTNAITIQGLDESGTTTLSSTTTYPTLKKNQKQYNGIATTTVTIKDMAGNTTNLIYTEKLPSPAKRDVISLVSISYNGATSSIPATLKYAWGMKGDGTYKKFASVFATSTVVIESHFRPKKNITVIMNKPIDMDDSDNDAEEGAEVDNRPVKTKLTGFIIPKLMTSGGEIMVTY